MLKIIGASESYVVLTTFCDGEPGAWNVWCHADEASWLIMTPPLKQHTLCCETYRVLYCRRAFSLGPSTSQCLPVPGGLWQGDGPTAACSWLCQACFHLLAT